MKLGTIFFAFCLLIVCPPGSRAESLDYCKPLTSPPADSVVVDNVMKLEIALAGAAAGTTILVEDGVYRLTKPLVFKNDRVSLRSKSGDRDKVVLTGKGMTGAGPPHAVVISASDIVIADLSIGNVPFHGIHIHGENGAMRPVLYNVRVFDSGQQLIKISAGAKKGQVRRYSDGGVLACSLVEYTDHAPSGYTNGIDVLAGKGWTVRDNEFRRIRGPEGRLSGPAVLLWQNSVGSVVERNLLLECSKGIAFGNPHGPNPEISRNGEKKFDHQGGIVRNNIIVRTSDGDTGIEFNKAKDFKCYHNTVYVYSSKVKWAIEYRFPVTKGVIRNNLTNMRVLKRDGAYAVVEGNMTYAEKGWFVDIDQGNAHLTDDAGEALDRVRAISEAAYDFEGERRPKGAAADIGADEK